MNHYNRCLIRSLIVFWLPCFLVQAALTAELQVRNEMGIGVILDEMSRPGKEAKVAIELAIQDFKIKTNKQAVLYLQNSRNKPIYAAIAAKELIDKHNVKAIIGGRTFEEASAIAEVISEADQDVDLPLFVSFATASPLQTTNQRPFFVQSVPTQSSQMKAVAAILKSWSIHNVSLIHETSHLASSSASIVFFLSQALRETGSELTHILPLTSDSFSLDEKLEELKSQQCKVFVIHTSLELAVRLFQTANKMGMTGYGYVWIATNEITDHLPSINPSTTYLLKGMTGVKTSISANMPKFQHFRKKFRQKFNSEYPDEEQEEPGIFAVQGYNTVIHLLDKNFQHWTPNPKTTVEIVYVIGKGYHSVYWTAGSGFSETIDNEATTTYTDSIDSLQDVLFPVGPWYANKYSREGFGSLQEINGKVSWVSRFAETILHGLLQPFLFIFRCLVQVLRFIWYLVETISYGLFLLFSFIYRGLVHVFCFIRYLVETIIYGLFRLFHFIYRGLAYVLGFIRYLAETIFYGVYLVFKFIFDGVVQVAGFIWYLLKTTGYGISYLFHFIVDGLVQVLGFIWYLVKTISYGLFLPFRFIYDGLMQVLGFIWYLGETIVFRLGRLFYYIYDGLAKMSNYTFYPAMTFLVWLIGRWSEICNFLDNIRTILGHLKPE